MKEKHVVPPPIFQSFEPFCFHFVSKHKKKSKHLVTELPCATKNHMSIRRKWPRRKFYINMSTGLYLSLVHATKNHTTSSIYPPVPKRPGCSDRTIFLLLPFLIPIFPLINYFLPFSASGSIKKLVLSELPAFLLPTRENKKGEKIWWTLCNDATSVLCSQAI